MSSCRRRRFDEYMSRRREGDELTPVLVWLLFGGGESALPFIFPFPLLVVDSFVAYRIDGLCDIDEFARVTLVSGGAGAHGRT